MEFTYYFYSQYQFIKCRSFFFLHFTALQLIRVIFTYTKNFKKYFKQIFQSFEQNIIIARLMDCEGSLRNILEQKTLRWIFVGGKGGVGKTTTSSSLATLLASDGRKTLIISTDPAHNLSDCFDQKVTKDPTPINGIPNLHAIEIDPKVDVQKLTSDYDMLNFGEDEGTKSLLQEILSSVPGIDEAMSFSQLINSIEKMDFDVIVFDTAPTGHTLRFLNFPNIFEKGLNKILTLKQKFSGIMSGMSGVFGSKEDMDTTLEKMFSKMETLREASKKVNEQMKDNEKTTFAAVCIPEFLPLYETDRLVQELTTFEIDIRNIVVNQVLFPEDTCRMCKARSKMQKKYLDQILDMYDDFHITVMPLQEQEVRGPEKLKNFSQMLLTPRKVPEIPQ